MHATRAMNRAFASCCGIAIFIGLADSRLFHLAAQTEPVESEAVSVLKQKCLQCHGDALQMSNLSLATREAMLKGGDKGPAIVPGDAEKSRLFRRVSGLESPKMPMAPMAPLTQREIGILKNWIESGA